MPIKVAIVILNWNGKKLLEQFLPSMVAFSSGADIYVADNASTDNSVSFITDNFPTVKIIINDANYGFAGGYNTALKNIIADIYVLVNSDIEVTENWLQPAIDAFTNDPQLAIVQPKIRDYKRKDYFEYAGAAGGFIDKYGYPFCRGRIFETIEKDTNQYNDDCEIFWASGACFFIRKKIYDDLGGFDDGFFAHQEEIDLCWRAFNKGYKAKYIAKSVVFHVGGATLNESNPRKTYLNFRNSLLMLLKNLPRKRLFLILFARLVLDGVAGLRFISQGKFPHCIAIIHAHFKFFKLFRINYLKRETLQKQNYFKLKSIVYRYFFKNGNIFGELF